MSVLNMQVRKNSGQTQKKEKLNKQQQQQQQQQHNNNKKRALGQEKITSSALINFYGHIRDTAIIENIRALISYYVIVTKAAFMILYNIALCS